MGRYDFVSIIKASSTEVWMKGLMTIGSAGAIKTETLQAIPLEEVIDILKDLP